jgi:UDP-N-acetylmuramoyl-tripeptide--D-alanyl-D-alanine ligase
MITFTLAEFAEAVDGRLTATHYVSDPEVAINGSVQTDSRLVEPGSVFFALRGDETDGHLFAMSAASQGAAVVVAERPLDVGVPVIVVADGVTALAALARVVVERVRALGRLKVVAITGSNGKTTTKNMLRAILSAEGPTVAPDGSFNNHVGAPISMLRIDEETRYLVVEMGASHRGEIAHLVSVARPDIAVVLKVGLAHVGEFGGIDAITLAKSEMVVDLPSTAVAVLNADDPRVAAMSGITRARVRTFGRGAGDLVAADVTSTLKGTTFTVAGDGVDLHIVGEHHVFNALAALSVADELGVDRARAITALAGMPRAERWRMELLDTPSGALVVNDAYNASPDSMAAALDALVHVTPEGSRTTAVLGEMTELGAASESEHNALGRLVARLGIDRLVVVGAAAKPILTGASAESGWRGRSHYAPTIDSAFALVSEGLGGDDVVLVKSSKSADLRFLGDRLAGVEA